MKRAFNILLGAMLLLSACDGGDVEVGKSNEIAFSAQHIQRGAMTQDDVDRGTVYVFGVQNNSTRIFTKTPITRDATTGKWFPQSKKNWVEGSSYSFYGYAYNTANGLTFVQDKDKIQTGLEIEVQQPTTYNESAMIDYLLSYAFKVADGEMKPVVQLHLEHAMALVEVYVVKGNMFDARLKSLSLENIYSGGAMKCTSQAIANSGERNIWQTTPSGTNDAKYTYTPATPITIGDERENTAAKMTLMCVPQQLTAATKLVVEYEVNEKISSSSPDNFVTHTEEFQLYNYYPMYYQSGHRIIYTATVDSGVNLVGVVSDWIDVDYIEGTVLPEIK